MSLGGVLQIATRVVDLINEIQGGAVSAVLDVWDARCAVLLEIVSRLCFGVVGKSMTSHSSSGILLGRSCSPLGIALFRYAPRKFQ